MVNQPVYRSAAPVRSSISLLSRQQRGESSPKLCDASRLLPSSSVSASSNLIERGNAVHGIACQPIGRLSRYRENGEPTAERACALRLAAVARRKINRCCCHTTVTCESAYSALLNGIVSINRDDFSLNNLGRLSRRRRSRKHGPHRPPLAPLIYQMLSLRQMRWSLCARKYKKRPPSHTPLPARGIITCVCIHPPHPPSRLPSRR